MPRSPTIAVVNINIYGEFAQQNEKEEKTKNLYLQISLLFLVMKKPLM